MPLTFKDVSEILKIIDESDIAELVVELGDTKIVVRRDGAGTSTDAPVTKSPAAAESTTAADTPVVEDTRPAPEPTAQLENAAADDEVREGLIGIRAPMVGTFYRKPGPQDPVFVEVNGHVEAGDPLCLIEVMKLFTTIEAPVAGRVMEIRAENEDLVQIDQLIFVIEPD